MARIAYIGLFFGITALATLASAGQVELSSDGLIRILGKESFRIITRCKGIPREDLVGAGLILKGRKVESFIVDRNESYQIGDGLVDPNKAQRQLIFSAISQKYLLLCFWMGGQGGPGRYLMVVHRGIQRPEVICYASLGTVGELRNLDDLCRLIKSNTFSIGKW